MNKFVFLPKYITTDETPKYSTLDAVGLDILADIQFPLVVQPGDVVKIHTGLKLDRLEEGVYGSLVSRSGLAVRYGFFILCGTIDPEYRGEICVIASTHKAFTINRGDRIAQLVLNRYAKFEGVLVEDVERGSGGFGSTGGCS